MGVTIGINGKNDGTGWSSVTVSTLGSGEGTGYTGNGTRKVYVSDSTGNDSNPGTKALPIKTLAKTYDLMRNGKPDWCLLKRGDTWRAQAFGRDNNGAQLGGAGGPDHSNPWLFTHYGTGARPIIQSDGSTQTPVFTVGNGIVGANNFAFIGLDCQTYTRNPADPAYVNASHAGAAISWLSDNADMWLLVEDCRFRFYEGAFYLAVGHHVPRGGYFYNRRNVVHKCWGGPGYGGTGSIASDVQNVLWEGCFYNECAMAPNDDPTWNIQQNANSHNVYWQDNNGVLEYHNNINTNAQYTNLKARAGVNASNNFFARGAEGIDSYGNNGTTDDYFTGTTYIQDNVFTEMRQTIRTGVPAGVNDDGFGHPVLDGSGNPTPYAGGGGAIQLCTISRGSLTGGQTYPGPIQVLRNIVAHQIATYTADAVNLSSTADNCVVSNNIFYKCTNGVNNSSGGVGNTITANKIDLNGDDAEGYGFPSPNNAKLGKYYLSIGGTDDFEAFCAARANMCRDNWDIRYTAPAVNDFMRTQFAMTTLGVHGAVTPSIHRSQINLNYMNGSSDYCMINRILAGDLNLQGNTPDILDANGWPTSVPGTAMTYGWFCESFEEYSGNWIIDWLGTGSIGLNGAHTTVNGSLSGTDGTYTFTNGSGNHFFFISINSTSAAPNNMRRVRCYRADEKTLLDAGEIFSPPFLAKLAAGGWGTVRFLKWQSQFATATILTRRSATYATYTAYHWRPDLYAGVSNTSGGAGVYACSAPPTWFGLVDKATIHVKWNADMVSATNTLAVGGTAAKPIKSSNGKSVFFAAGSAGEGPGAGKISTMIYDATLGVWMLNGGNYDVATAAPGGSHGISDGVPWEIMIALANKANMHPWFNTPYVASYPLTDYMPGLAQMCHDTLNTGLIPHFEGVNEPWNSGGDKAVQYLVNIGEAKWGTNNPEDPLGMTLSLLGQAVSAIYGGDRSKYEIMVGVHTDAGESLASYTDYILNSSQYVTIDGGSAAINWVTCLTPANYFRETVSEAAGNTMADAYVAADTAGKATIANDYANSAFAEGTFGLPQLKRHYQGWLTYAATKGLKVKPYEGGYSPDFNPFFSSNIDFLRSASKDAPITGALITQNYADITGLGAISPSQFSFVGPANDSWAIIRPDLYGTPSPQFPAVQTFNGSLTDVQALLTISRPRVRVR